MGNNNLREVEYYNYHKNSYYTNKYPNKKPNDNLHVGDCS